MSEFDEVLHRIQNQLDKMKKSLRSHNRDLARVTSSRGLRKQESAQSGDAEKKLPVEPPPKPPRK